MEILVLLWSLAIPASLLLLLLAIIFAFISEISHDETTRRIAQQRATKCIFILGCLFMVSLGSCMMMIFFA